MKGGPEWDKRLLRFVVINGTTRDQWRETHIGFGGSDMWRELLNQEEVPDEYIFGTGPAYHTGAEADELVRIARERVLQVVTIVAMPYHILRCFLTTIKAMEKARHYLDVYSFTLPLLFWLLRQHYLLLNSK